MKPFRTEDNIATIRAFIMEENMDNQKVLSKGLEVIKQFVDDPVNNMHLLDNITISDYQAEKL